MSGRKLARLARRIANSLCRRPDDKMITESAVHPSHFHVQSFRVACLPENQDAPRDLPYRDYVCLGPRLAVRRRTGPAEAGRPRRARRRPHRSSPIRRSPIKLPALFNDASFEAFRKQLGEVAAKKDRAGLAKLVVAQGFFWDGEKGNQADAKKSGVDNLAQAIGLAGKQPVGWDMLQGMALDPTASAYPGKQGVICAPGRSAIRRKAARRTRQVDRHRSGRLGLSAGHRYRGPLGAARRRSGSGEARHEPRPRHGRPQGARRPRPDRCRWSGSRCPPARSASCPPTRCRRSATTRSAT